MDNINEFYEEYFEHTDLNLKDESTEIMEHCENLVLMIEIDKPGSQRNMNIRKQVLKLFKTIATPYTVKKMNRDQLQRLADILDILKIASPDRKK